MQHRWRGMENLTQPVTTEIAHDRKPLAFNIALDGMADIAQRGAGFDHFNRLHQGLVGHIDQPLGLHADLVATEIHPAGVAVPAIEDDRNIDIQNIAIQQFLVARYAVTHHVIDRDTGGLGKALVIQRGRDRAIIERELMQNLVELAGGDARLDVWGDHIEGFGG